MNEGGLGGGAPGEGRGWVMKSLQVLHYLHKPRLTSSSASAKSGWVVGEGITVAAGAEANYPEQEPEDSLERVESAL